MKKPHQIQCYILITSINSESLTTRAGYFFYNFQELTTNMKQYDQTITIQQEREITLREEDVQGTSKSKKAWLKGVLRNNMKNIWDYAQELGRSNEGTTIKIDCIPIPHSQPQFE